MRATAVLLILAISSFTLLAQTPIIDPDPLSEIKRLLAAERWGEIVRLAQTEAAHSADLAYYYGMALARLERWDDATRAFQNGLRQKPGDKRFYLELAGVCFKQKNYSQAAGHLRLALRIDPQDTYANDFLASLYFLEGNLEAALKHWNLVSKPEIEEVRSDPAPRVDPVLLDRAFAFAPAAVLRLSELQTAKARVSGLRIFAAYRFDLEARSDGRFDVVFRARERNGWGNNKWEGLLSLLRGLPFQAVHPEFFNIKRRAINVESLVRWDPEKQRVWANLSGPFSGDSKWRYQLDLDLRDENWVIRRSSAGREMAGRLKLRKQAFTAAVTAVENGRWDWSTGVELSHRDYRNVIPGDALTPSLLAPGLQLEHLAQFNYQLARLPERRLFVSAGASTRLGRIWSPRSHIFAKLQSSLAARWLPQARGDDYEMQGKIRLGRTLGEIPFDELFVLGIERDNDLWLRSHVGTRNGRKGSAPLGRNYFLSNWELDKNVYSHALVSLKLGPFLDSGKVTDPSPGLGSQTWLWDMGVQAKVRVLGLGIAFCYGKDLRAGNNAFYVTLFR